MCRSFCDRVEEVSAFTLDSIGNMVGTPWIVRVFVCKDWLEPVVGDSAPISDLLVPVHSRIRLNLTRLNRTEAFERLAWQGLLMVVAVEAAARLAA